MTTPRTAHTAAVDFLYELAAAFDDALNFDDLTRFYDEYAARCAEMAKRLNTELHDQAAARMDEAAYGPAEVPRS